MQPNTCLPAKPSVVHLSVIDKIAVGMGKESVFSILGEPKSKEEDVWIYEFNDGDMMRVCYIYFIDGLVSQKEERLSKRGVNVEGLW